MERAWACDEPMEPCTYPGLPILIQPLCFVRTIYYTLYVNLNKAGFLIFEAKYTPNQYSCGTRILTQEI